MSDFWHAISPWLTRRGVTLYDMGPPKGAPPYAWFPDVWYTPVVSTTTASTLPYARCLRGDEDYSQDFETTVGDPKLPDYFSPSTHIRVSPALRVHRMSMAETSCSKSWIRTANSTVYIRRYIGNWARSMNTRRFHVSCHLSTSSTRNMTILSPPCLCTSHPRYSHGHRSNVLGFTGGQIQSI